MSYSLSIYDFETDNEKQTVYTIYKNSHPFEIVEIDRHNDTDMTDRFCFDLLTDLYPIKSVTYFSNERI
jgi:hypothetical protein